MSKLTEVGKIVQVISRIFHYLGMKVVICVFVGRSYPHFAPGRYSLQSASYLSRVAFQPVA